jgi:hypothetical protein
MYLFLSLLIYHFIYFLHLFIYFSFSSSYESRLDYGGGLPESAHSYATRTYLSSYDTSPSSNVPIMKRAPIQASMPIQVFICLFIQLFIQYLFIFLFIYLFINLFIDLFIFYLFIFIYLFTYLLIYLLIDLFIYLFII